MINIEQRPAAAQLFLIADWLFPIGLLEQTTLVNLAAWKGLLEKQLLIFMRLSTGTKEDLLN